MLNRSGMFILNALQSGRDHQQAASLLGEEYALRSDDAERDVNDFLSRLRTFGLI